VTIRSEYIQSVRVWRSGWWSGGEPTFRKRQPSHFTSLHFAGKCEANFKSFKSARQRFVEVLPGLSEREVLGVLRCHHARCTSIRPTQTNGLDLFSRGLANGTSPSMNISGRR